MLEPGAAQPARPGSFEHDRGSSGITEELLFRGYGLTTDTELERIKR